MGPAEFDALVADALDELPRWTEPLLANVVVLVESRPPPGMDVLGLYEGTPLTERSDGEPLEPDAITIFREPILADAATPAEVREQVRITVLHEVAHHFGIDDDRLAELGFE